MAKYLVPQSLILDSSRISSTTSEDGLVLDAPVEDTVTGTMELKSSGDPTSAVSIRVQAKTTGLPLGFSPAQRVANGASLIWKDEGDADTQYYGFGQRYYPTWLDCPPQSTAIAASYWGWTSALRPTVNKGVAFVVHNINTVANTFACYVKTGRYGSWAHTVIATESADLVFSSVGHAPGLIVMDDGRLIAYTFATPLFSATGQRIVAYVSSDNGATWTLLEPQCYTHSSATPWTVLRAEVVDGDVAIILGYKLVSTPGIQSLVSRSDGLKFTAVGSENTAFSMPDTCVTKGGRLVIMAQDNTGVRKAVQLVAVPGVDVGNDDDWVEAVGAEWTESACVWADDDGTLWNVAITTQTGAWNLAGSSDGGSTWSPVTLSDWDSQEMFGIFDTASGNLNYLGGIQAGAWRGGEATAVGRSEAANAGTQDGTLYAVALGGWDQDVAESPSSSSIGQPYQVAWFAMDTPLNLGWFRTQYGGGATITRQGGYLRIAGGVGIGTLYQSPTQWRTKALGGTGARMRFIFKGAGGTENLGDDRSIVDMRLNGSATDQWFRIRLGNNDIRVIDSAGTIATTSLGSNHFQEWTEVFCSFQTDAGSVANTGLLSIWYKLDTDPVWTLWVDAQDVAGVASGTARVAFGTSAATAGGPMTTDMMGIWVAADSGDLNGFTVPDDMPGRDVGSLGMALDNEVEVSGFGGYAFTGDEWLLETVSPYPSSNIVDSSSPSKVWRTTSDSTDRVVFDSGTTNFWLGDTVLLTGTNMRQTQFQANGTDAWGAPAQTVTLDATVLTISAAPLYGPGYIEDATLNMVPHEYASKPGHRYWLEIGESGAVYEILDNTRTRIMIEDRDLTAAQGTAYVFQDKMWGRLPISTYRYIALTLLGKTKIGKYQVGRLQFGDATEMNQTKVGSRYSYGYTDSHGYNTFINEGSSGQRYSTIDGPARHSLTLSWSPANAMSGDWERELDALHRLVDGPAEVVGFVRDSTESSLHRNGSVYRSIGVLQRRNVRGEGDDALTSLSGITLEEEV